MTIVLIGLSLPYVLCAAYIGRHAPAARLPAFLSALCFVVAMPLLSDTTAMHLDTLIPVVGIGRLLTHVSFMGMFLFHYLVIATVNERSQRQKFVIVGLNAAVIALFVLFWAAVHLLPAHSPSALYYGSRGGNPAVLWTMNIVMGGGLSFAALCNEIEYVYALRRARTRPERLRASSGVLIFMASIIPGFLTISEATARHFGMNGTQAYNAKIPVTEIVVAFGIVVVLCQVFIWPVWEGRKELALRYARPEWVKLRGDLVDLIVFNDQRETENHSEVYANRQIVAEVEARCVADNETAEDCKLSVEATRLITNRRANVIDAPDNLEADSWADLNDEVRNTTDKLLADTAWDYVERQIYFLSDKMLLIALVLGPDRRREKNHRAPAVRHYRLAARIATVMGEFGQATPLLEALQGQQANDRHKGGAPRALNEELAPFYKGRSFLNRHQTKGTSRQV